MLSQKNVHDSLSPLILLTKFSGFNIFSIDRRTFEVTFSRIDIVLIVFNSFLPIFLNYFFTTTYFFTDIHHSEVIETYFPVVVYLNFVISCCGKLWLFCCRRQFAEILETINNTDIDLRKLGSQFNYSTINVIKTISSILALFVCAMFFYATQFYYGIVMNLGVFLFTFYGFFCNMIVVNIFITLIQEVELRLEAMKRVIR